MIAIGWISKLLVLVGSTLSEPGKHCPRDYFGKKAELS
jgi:hypothetical protein